MKRLYGIVAMCLAVMLFQSRDVAASFVSLDSVYGTDTITLDTDSGLRWLDVPLTTAYSYNGILPELTMGGEFYGFRVAYRAEVEELYVHAGIPQIGNTFVADNYVPVKMLMSYVGVTGNNGNLGTGIPFDYTSAHVFDPVLPQVGWIWAATLSVYEPDQTARASVSSTVPADNENPYHGTWLVAVQSVPEPPSHTLLLLGLMLLAIGSRSVSRYRKIAGFQFLPFQYMKED